MARREARLCQARSVSAARPTLVADLHNSRCNRSGQSSSIIINCIVRWADGAVFPFNSKVKCSNQCITRGGCAHHGGRGVEGKRWGRSGAVCALCTRPSRRHVAPACELHPDPGPAPTVEGVWYVVQQTERTEPTLERVGAHADGAKLMWPVCLQQVSGVGCVCRLLAAAVPADRRRRWRNHLGPGCSWPLPQLPKPLTACAVAYPCPSAPRPGLSQATPCARVVLPVLWLSTTVCSRPECMCARS